jgi:aspartyl-tRNA(Asn)/glutamyl-tRNA(Gln) amidotransferase subunit B
MAARLTPTVGLEIHVRLATGGKLFCSCEFRFGAPPNSLVCPVCLGLPGSLPVLDRQAVSLALRAGVALEATLNPVSEFARKNYFYPDLPRNYQITQYERPLFRGGALDLRGVGGPRVRLSRLHLEEDAGRSLAVPAEEENLAGHSLVDLNRAGTPLLEIVTEPDLQGGDQARFWLQNLLQTLQHCGVCAGKMAEGDLRCDVNVGLDGAGSGPLSETKNLNSFRHVAQAVDHEIERLQGLARNGDRLVPTTRGWDPARRCTTFLRNKEETRDYRYFPEPDLPLLTVPAAEFREEVALLPELPVRRRQRLMEEWHLEEAEARALCRNRSVADFWEEVTVALDREGVAGAGRLAASWVLGPLRDDEVAPADQAGTSYPPPGFVVDLLGLLADSTINSRVARRVLHRWRAGRDTRLPREMVAQEGWGQITDPAVLGGYCDQVLAARDRVVQEYLGGRETVLEYLLGQVLELTRGKGHPGVVRRLLVDKLEQYRP